MKEKLKQNGGFAIVSVVFLLLVLSLMGTAMYLYSVTSLRSVRFLSDKKKAEYLAQAGVEAAAYAYQLAVNSDNATAVNMVSEAGQMVTDPTTGEQTGKKITTEKVYMVYSKTDKKYYYVKESEAAAYETVIGYYTVTLTSDIEESTLNLLKKDMNSASGLTRYPVSIKESQKFIEAKGYTEKGSVAKKQAYLAEPVQALGKYYFADGVIDGSTNGKNKQITYIDDDGTEKTANVPEATVSAFDVIGQFQTGSSLTIKYSMFTNLGWLSQFIGFSTTYTIPIDNETVPILMAYTTGNMILNEPSGAKKITFKPNRHNFVSFVGKTNLFVNTNIDVTPSKSYFNVLYLRGNNIVINGDIDIYVYGFRRSMLQRLTTIYSALSRNYCWSTVIIGTSDLDSVTVTDPNTAGVYTTQPTISGDQVVLPSNAGYGRCGKIFFGGNVYINIQIPNVGTYRYKAFNSGDAYYYDDNLPQYYDGEDGYGIDLFKYFVDYAVATKKYSKNVLSRFAEVMGMYYSSNGDNVPMTYVIGDGNGTIIYNAMRKIDKSICNKDTYASLVPPNASDAASLTWVLG